MQVELVDRDHEQMAQGPGESKRQREEESTDKEVRPEIHCVNIKRT